MGKTVALSAIAILAIGVMTIGLFDIIELWLNKSHLLAH